MCSACSKKAVSICSGLPTHNEFPNRCRTPILGPTEDLANFVLVQNKTGPTYKKVS